MRKNIIRIVALLMAIMMLLGVVGAVIQFAQGASLEEGIYGYGAGLNEAQIEETKSLLGIEEVGTQIKITGEDSLKYINEKNQDSSMVSSIYAKSNDDNVIRVEIMTPLMITDVTSVQYSNAAITAGLNNLDINVAAIRKVTGTSALTGVYKIMEVLGEPVDVERTEAANDEIKVINVIAKNHEDDENFSKEKLNKVVIEVKQDLVEKKEQNGTVTTEEVGTVVQNVIKDNNLDTVINDIDIENLTIMFSNFINIENLNINLVKEQLENLSKEAPEIADRELGRIKEFLNTEKGKEFLDSISDNLNKENLQDVLDNAKNSLDSPEVENIIDSIKNSVSKENIDNIIEGAKDAIGGSNNGSGSNASGNFLDKIADFFTNIFTKISEFISGLVGVKTSYIR